MVDEQERTPAIDLGDTQTGYVDNESMHLEGAGDMPLVWTSMDLPGMEPAQADD
jgi:hypothetical protein